MRNEQENAVVAVFLAGAPAGVQSLRTRAEARTTGLDTCGRSSPMAGIEDRPDLVEVSLVGQMRAGYAITEPP